MTFKHNSNFSESEVMRSLERLAIERGEFDPTPEEVVKTAASKLPKKEKAIEETDSLFADIVQLAEHLRGKGFVQEAEEIETNLMMYKKAEKHLYNVHDETGEDFLNYVYKDGDKEVAPAKEDYGVVHTPQSAAKKIRETVDKKPTGELKEAANAILKGAQTFEFMNDQESIGNNELSGLYKDIKNNLEDAKESLKIGVTMNDGETLYSFTTGRLLGALGNPKYNSYLELYKDYTGTDISTFKNFYRRYTAIYGENNPISPATIVAQINKVSPTNSQQLMEWARNAGNFDNFFWGSKKDVTKQVTLGLPQGHPLTPDNPQSIWEVGALMGENVNTPFNKDSSQVQRVANQIHAAMQQLMERVFAGVDKANSKIQEKLRNVVNTLNSVDFSSAASLINRKLTKELIDNLRANMKILSPYIPGHDRNTELNRIMSAFGVDPKPFNNAMKSVVSNANKIYRAVTPGAKEITDPQVVATRFKKAAVLYREYARKLGEDNPNYELAMENADSAQNLADVAESIKGQSYQFLYNQIKEAYPEINTWKKFDLLSQDWLTGAREDTNTQSTTEASIKVTELTKFADIKRRKSLKPTGVSGKTTSTPAQQGAARVKEARPTEEERQKVSLMQKNINDFAIALHQAPEKVAEKIGGNPESELQITYLQAKASIIGDTGRNKFDGMWGQKTQDSLRLIAQIFQQAEITIPEFLSKNSFRQADPEEVISKSDKNTSIISSGMKELGLSAFVKNPPKGQEVKFEYYDAIPQTLTRENITSVDSGKNYIYKDDLSSLTKFYDLLTGTETLAQINERVASGIVDEKLIKAAQEIIDPWANKEEKAAETGGISQAQMDAALKWMYQRANFRLSQAFNETPPNPEKIKKAKEYRNAISGLIAEWNNKKGRFESNEAITREKLIDEGATRVKKDERSQGDTAERTRGESAEGFDVTRQKIKKIVQKAPFASRIDVTDMMYNWDFGGIDVGWYENNVLVPVLSISEFRRMPPQRFYQDVIPPSEYKTSDGMYILKKHPAVYIQTFLNKLMVDFAKVFANWLKEYRSLKTTDERLGEVVSEQKYMYNQWQRALKTMMRRNSDWLRKGTKGLPGNLEVEDNIELGY